MDQQSPQPRRSHLPPPRRRRSPWGLLAIPFALVVVLGLWIGIGGLHRGPFVLVEGCTATVQDNEYTYRPEQTRNTALLTSIAIERSMPARAATIAIATARQESDLENINYGDRDSVGLFQQRPSQGWGTVEQIMDPVYSTNKFYDALDKIDAYESLEITVAAQKVQRSAFPEAYGDHELEGRLFASALTGYSPGALTCRLKAADADSAATAQEVIADLPSYAKGATASGNSTVTIPEQDSRTGWAIAQFAVAYAKKWGATSVSYGGKTWDRAEPGKGWADDSDASASQVVITLAS